MRATILPKAIILTKAHMGYCGMNTVSEVFLIFYYPTIFISVQS